SLLFKVASALDTCDLAPAAVQLKFSAMDA
ncbi:unnamed protein product, partial [marine sediment metagenome]